MADISALLQLLGGGQSPQGPTDTQAGVDLLSGMGQQATSSAVSQAGMPFGGLAAPAMAAGYASPSVPGPVELSVNDILDVKQRVMTPRELAGKRGVSEEQIYAMYPELREWRSSPAPKSPQPQPETPPQQSGRQRLLETLAQPPKQEEAKPPHPSYGIFAG